MEDQYLSQPLLRSCNVPTTRTAKDITTYAHNTDALHVHKLRSSISSILVRLISIVFIGALAIWANYEACRGSHTSIINNAYGSPVGHHFRLFYASNDMATRTIILNATDIVQDVHYLPEKTINRVMLTLISQNLIKMVGLFSPEKHKYAITISASLLEENDTYYAAENALHHAVARIWLWGDSESCIPATFLEVMVEYINSTLAGFDNVKNLGHGAKSNCISWEDEDPKWLSYCEGQQNGVFQRLHQAVSDCILKGESATNSCNATIGATLEQAAKNIAG